MCMKTIGMKGIAQYYHLIVVFFLRKQFVIFPVQAERGTKVSFYLSGFANCILTKVNQSNILSASGIFSLSANLDLLVASMNGVVT